MKIILTKTEMAWTHDEPCRVFQYDVRGYPPGEGASIAQDPHRGWSIMRWNQTQQTEWMEDFPTADAALAELQARFDQGDSAFISRKKIEGSLDIVCMNFGHKDEMPLFVLHFMPYQGFKNGAQKSKEVSGEDALKRYLEQLGFALIRIYDVVTKVRTHCSADLPNVLMNEYHYTMTYRN